MARDRRAREDLVSNTAHRLGRGDSRRDILDGLRFRGLTREEAEAILREASPPHGWAFKTPAVLLVSLVIGGTVFWLTELRGEGPILPTFTRSPTPTPSAAPALPTLIPFATATAILAPVAAAPTPSSEGEVPILEPLPLPISLLTFRVIDAEYSKKLDRIIMVSSSPNQLHVYDPFTQKDTVVDLPLLPSAVSVSPDGQYAAVGHDAWVSLVDLVSGTLENILPVPANIGGVVLAGNGYTYAFPAGCCGFCSFYSIEVDTGKVFEPRAGITPWCGKVAQLHPSGKYLYSANPGHPEDLEKFGIQEGPIQPLYGSNDAFDHRPCGKLWLSEDGLRIFTKCGIVFRSSDVRSEDMVYNGSLREAEGFIRHLTHSDVIDKVMVIPQAGYTGGQMWDTQIQVYDYKFLTFEKALGLPEFVVGDRSYPGHGRFVFVTSDGSRILVVLQADETSGMLFDYGVVDLSTQDFLTVTPRPTPTPTLPPTPAPTPTTLAAVNFDGDVPGQAPKIGGANQPTSLLGSQGTTMAVRSEANGIATQPVVLTSEGGYVSVDISFDPVNEGVVRVEATVAFNRLVDGFFLQASVSVVQAVVTRLKMRCNGDIESSESLAAQAQAVTVGSYAPNEPFRVRVDIHISANTWSVTVDNELNGFDDDMVFKDLAFVNPTSALPHVGAIGASLSLFETICRGPTSVAYDDIRVSAPHQRPLG